MDIVCSLDNNYVMPTGIMICSLCENNKGEKIVFHLLSADISEDNKNRLRTLVAKYHHELNFYHIDDKDFADFPINRPGQRHIHSLATYYRLFLGKILPDTVQKVLYLDGDIIVRHSLKTLWNTDIENYAVAAVPDMDNNKIRPYERLHYSSAKGYFNAGVLLINIKYWREHNVLDKFYELVRTHPERLRCHDQDILNYIFRDRKLRLNVTYNFQQPFLYKAQYLEMSSDIINEINKVICDPVIIHYIMSEKPWFKDCSHPYKSEFKKYQALTEWRNVPEGYRHFLKNSIIGLIRYVGTSLGFKNVMPIKFRTDIKIHNETQIVQSE